MGGQEFIGQEADIDRLFGYQGRVAVPEFFSRPVPQPTRSGLPKSLFELLMAAADSGDAFSQTICGYRFWAGDDVTQDFEKAANCFKMAANQGHAVG
jgi:TPR repeat protein